MKLAFISYNRDPSLPNIDTDGGPDTVRNIALELALLGDKIDIYVNKLIPREEDSVYLHNKFIQQKEDKVSLNNNVKVIRIESKRLPYRSIYDTNDILDIADITDSYLSAQKYKDTLNKYDYVCVFHPLACIGILLGGFSNPEKTILFPMLLSDEYKKYQKVSNAYCDLEQKTLEMSKVIFCGSKIEIDTLGKRGVNKNKLFLASRGYNNLVFKGVPKTISKVKNKDVVLTCVGSIRSQKNQVQLVQIAKLLKDRNINPIVNIIGDNINFPNPDHKTYYDDMVNMIKQLGLVKNFIFCGRLNSKQIAEVLSKTDFAVFTSKAESFGKAALESICMGVPTIIRKDVLAYQSFAKNNINALLVKGTSKSFADSVVYMIANPEVYKKISINGIKTGKLFSWKNVASNIRKVLVNHSNENNKIN